MACVKLADQFYKLRSVPYSFQLPTITDRIQRGMADLGACGTPREPKLISIPRNQLVQSRINFQLHSGGGYVSQIDAAILDVNLDGEMVYSLAEILIARNIPFVFATGYGAESIEKRFEHIPVLQKPIEKNTLRRIFVRSDIPQAPVPHQNAGRSERGRANAI